MPWRCGRMVFVADTEGSVPAQTNNKSQNWLSGVAWNKTLNMGNFEVSVSDSLWVWPRFPGQKDHSRSKNCLGGRILALQQCYFTAAVLFYCSSAILLQQWSITAVVHQNGASVAKIKMKYNINVVSVDLCGNASLQFWHSKTKP